MRAGFSTIQQTLTPEAATVLNQSIADASRRNHGQTTPLHVAATLMASPSGYMRQACIRSHPNSSHPLQCRALELCFRVALDRLPTVQNAEAPVTEPPISNALMAALKRAQAHQRRGCPEQQQQPLLAMKVELEQLIISILDDPSVSRVMREASFSSPAVKATIEQYLTKSSALANHQHHQVAAGNVNFGSSFGGSAPRMLPNPSQLNATAAQSSSPSIALVNRNMYSNPRLQQGEASTSQIGSPRNGEVKKVFDIMSRSQKRNPILVGNSEPEAVAKELFRKIENKEFRKDEDLNNVQIISIEKGLSVCDKNQIASKIEELGRMIESRIRNGGVILNLGDLKWLVEQPGPSLGAPQQHQKSPVVSDMGRVVVVEMTKLISRFRRRDGPDEANKFWLIGTATCETYLRCQVYHSTMENDWDLQSVPIASRTTLPGMFSRLGSDLVLSNPVESINQSNSITRSLPGLSNPMLSLNPMTHVPNPIPRSRNPTESSLSPMKAIPSPIPASRYPMESSLNPLQSMPNPIHTLRNPVEGLSSAKVIPSPSPDFTMVMPENLDAAKNPTFCSQCSGNYKKELAKLAAFEKSLSIPKKHDTTQSSLPQWLRKAKPNNPDAKTVDDESHMKNQGLLSQQKTQELHNKWRDTCLRLHPNFHQTARPDKTGPPPALSMTGTINPNILARQSKLLAHKPLGATLRLNSNPVTTSPLTPVLARSPVRTDLVLGTEGPDSIRAGPAEDQAKDLLGCISSETQTKPLDKFSNALDADTYKKLLRGLMENAWWQAEAASSVAAAITRCRLGNGKRRGSGPRGDIWLLFTGPDRVGKRKMASVLADQVYGANPVIICLGRKREDQDSDTGGIRGKTAVDRMAEALRRNPFSVIMLRDIDEADLIVRGNIKRALERGRLTDSNGREVGLGNGVFIVTGDWSTINPEASKDGHFLDEKKLASTASGSWQLGLIVRDKSAKRRPSWLSDENNNRQSRPRREIGFLSLDLNLAGPAYTEDESLDSSELTFDHQEEFGLVDGRFEITSVPHDLVSSVDDSIVFKPVDAAFVRREIKKTISVKFSMVVDENLPIEIGDDVVEKIVGGLWHDRTSLVEWVEEAVGPSFEELKTRLPSGDRNNSVVRLVVESDSCDRGNGGENADWLPSSILV